MSKIKCLQCGQVLESKHRHDFQQCDCENETFIDGGNCEYVRYGGKDISKMDIIFDDTELGTQKSPSSVAKIEAERKNTLNRIKEIYND